jgi:hypothetical protein
MTSSTPVSEQVRNALPTQEEWKQKLALLEDIAEDLGLPKFGDFTEEDITPDMIQAAIMEQVENTEARIACTKTGEVGAIKRWENREKNVLPLWFHIPAGKGVIKRLLGCGRFSIPEIAQMLGLRERALKDIIKGMGLSQLVVNADREQKLRKYRELIAEYATRGRMLTTVIAMQTAEKMLIDPEDPSKGVLKVNVKDLVGLNKILVANDPVFNEGAKGTGGQMPSVGIGVKVTHINKNYRPGDTSTEVEAEILDEPPDE